MEKTDIGTAEQAKNVLSQQLNIEQDNFSDLDIVEPVPEILEISGKRYEIKPLPLRKIKLLLRLTHLQDKFYNEETVDEVIDAISEILGEKDKAFIENNIDVHKIGLIFSAIAKVNFRGVPIQKKKAVTSDIQNLK